MNNIVITSLYGNPLHLGHLEYLEEAKKLGYHICIVNNDNQVKLKGSTPLLNEETRLGIVDGLKCVDMTVLSIDGGVSVSQTLGMLGTLLKHHHVFFCNSGDQIKWNPNEKIVCERYGIKMKFLKLPKINSSSEIIQNIERLPRDKI